jgi:hypothetical protein
MAGPPDSTDEADGTGVADGVAEDDGVAEAAEDDGVAEAMATGVGTAGEAPQAARSEAARSEAASNAASAGRRDRARAERVVMAGSSCATVVKRRCGQPTPKPQLRLGLSCRSVRGRL